MYDIILGRGSTVPERLRNTALELKNVDWYGYYHVTQLWIHSADCQQDFIESVCIERAWGWNFSYQMSLSALGHLYSRGKAPPPPPKSILWTGGWLGPARGGENKSYPWSAGNRTLVVHTVACHDRGSIPANAGMFSSAPLTSRPALRPAGLFHPMSSGSKAPGACSWPLTFI
jgi:hypothetical protein